MLKRKFVYISIVMALLASLLVPAFGGAVALAANAFYDFQSGNANGWTTYGGTWAVVNGEYTVNAGAGNKSVISGSNYNSFIYEADVNVGTGGNAGFIIRAGSLGTGADAYTGYYIGLDSANNKVQMGKVNNNWTLMINYPFTVTPNTWYHLKVVASGGSVDTYVGNTHVLSTFDKTFLSGAVGLRVFNTSAKFDNVRVTDNGVVNSPVYNWSGKKGALFVPSNAVNMIEMWQNYDSTTINRELSYAKTYGFNSIAVYLPFLVWENNPTGILNNFENFLTLANNHGMKVSPIFFDDCWGQNPALGAQGAPIPGVHNSRWVQSPGNNVRNNYFTTYKTPVRNYVQAFVNAHKTDSRILFWEQMNEPGCNNSYDMTINLMNDARIAIKETGSTIPVSSCSCQFFEGQFFSDFFSYHDYSAAYNAGPKGTEYFMTEGMARGIPQSIPGIVSAYGGSNTGWIVWELMIGRTNTRFPWGSAQGAPEPATPFHGVVYPDGHPWSTADIVAINGAIANMPVYTVNYYNGVFATFKKGSVTPLIDFDLNTEPGTSSPDASAGVSSTNYSIRWTGMIRPATTGTFTFFADSDNKARIWVNNVQVVNKTNAGRSEVSGTIALTANTNYAVKVEYEHTTGTSNMHVQWSGPSLSKQVLRVQPGGGGGGTVNRFESLNIVGNFIRHANSRGRIDPNVNPLADSQFILVPGLADPAAVSFQSVNFPGSYLRHRNGEIWLDASDGSALFNADATFYRRPGLANSAYASFESYNFPGNYIRHRNSLLYSEAGSGAPFISDATFIVR